MRRSLCIVGVCAMLFMSCGMSEDEIWSKADAPKHQSNAKERLQYCRMLVEKYPKSPHAPDALWKAATICNDELREYATAVGYYKDYYRLFADRPDAPKALFLTAFIYNNELRNYDSARVLYTDFMQRYPGNELAASAKYELEHLGQESADLIPQQPQIAKKKR